MDLCSSHRFSQFRSTCETQHSVIGASDDHSYAPTQSYRTRQIMWKLAFSQATTFQSTLWVFSQSTWLGLPALAKIRSIELARVLASDGIGSLPGRSGEGYHSGYWRPEGSLMLAWSLGLCVTSKVLYNEFMILTGPFFFFFFLQSIRFGVAFKLSETKKDNECEVTIWNPSKCH